MAREVGFPVMLKASWGGGGRGMRIISSEAELDQEVLAGKREAEAAFGNGEVYLEKLVEKARHVEVQLLGDSHGNIIHLFERDCSIQRRNQKVVERAPAPYLSPEQRTEVCEAALKLARRAGYVNAGTAEFLMDSVTGQFYFIEVNPRIQVEHTVTEEITGIDIVKAQIRIAQGAKIGAEGSGVPAQDFLEMRGHAIQCRVTTEDPEENFIPRLRPDHRLSRRHRLRHPARRRHRLFRCDHHALLRLAAGKGDGLGADPRRGDRAHGPGAPGIPYPGRRDQPQFRGKPDQPPELPGGRLHHALHRRNAGLFAFPKRRDRATRLLRFIADVTVNGNPEVENRPRPPAHALQPRLPELKSLAPVSGAKAMLDAQGPKAVADWMLAERRVLVTDTTMRDAPQSLLATRFRSHDIVQSAPAYAANLAELFSLECWGGATFDVAMRFLQECPWERLEGVREGAPNILLQMLLRGANGVGYAVYPDNVVRAFVARAASSGIDVFRVFDSLNWVENMRVSMDAVLESGKILEASVCYTGDILDPARPKYALDYYVGVARELAAAGTHILGLKDMGGLVKPEAARILVRALKEETGLPVHFHTHDTSGISAASVLAACEAGVDAVDAAMDSMSGMTSQPNLGSIVEALRHTERDTGLDIAAIRGLSDYWEAVRVQYAAFEADMRAGASEVYLHEMPGGQFTNLKEQARSLGLADRWHDVARTYADVNQMFGDIVKVTPSSKVVGDMALSMVSAGLTRKDVEDPDRDVSFPESVIALFKGELGQPPGGFPEALQKKILKGEEPLTKRPGADVPPADLDALRQDAEKAAHRKITDEEFNSYLMYPKVFVDYARRKTEFGPVSVLPTPIFFYGMQPGQEVAIDLEAGKTLQVRCQAVGETDEEGNVKMFFELNGQPRTAKVVDRAAAAHVDKHPKADPANPNHVAAPMPGVIATVAAAPGQDISAGDLLCTIEAMKMETAIHAERDGRIGQVVVAAGTQVDAKDLLFEFAE